MARSSAPLAVAALAAAGSVWFFLRSSNPPDDALSEFRREMKAIDDGLKGQPPPPLGPYDWKSARANLEHIGRQLRIYRKEHPPKPTRERRTARDAGLPDSLFAALCAPQNPWTTARIHFLAARSRDIKGELRMLRDPKGVTHLTQLYTVGNESDERWGKDGEKVPVLADLNMLADPSKDSGEVLVLLLDGTVQKRRYAKGEIGQPDGSKQTSGPAPSKSGP